MKKLKFLWLMLALSGNFNIFAQECYTEPLDSTNFEAQPWIGNNQLLYDLADSVSQLAIATENTSGYEGGFDGSVVYWVPLKFWVYHTSTNPGVEQDEIERAVRTLNDQFAGRLNTTGQAHNHSHVQFYIKCEITYLNDPLGALNPDEGRVTYRMNNNFEPGAINVHVPISYPGGIARLPLMHYVPGYKPYATFTGQAFLNTSTFAHEIGHTLGLLHTHDVSSISSAFNEDVGNCRQEPVSRTMTQPLGCLNFTGNKKCEVNGDGLCDTEADPGLARNGVYRVTTTGVFSYTGTDNWGVIWTPNIYNIMSYSRPQFRELFTTGQQGVMYHWIEGVPNWAALGYPYLNKDASFIDVYEPDNFRSNLNPAINFGSIQHRGFHKVPNGKRNDITSWNNCDEDWVRIQVPHNGFKASIYTTGVPNGQDVDTELFLYHQNGTTLIASHDNKSTNDLYSEILEVTLNQGTYWVRVVNKGNGDGEYLLHLERCGIECCFNDLLSNVNLIDQSTGNLVIGARVSGTAEEYFGFSTNVSQATFGANIPGSTAFGLGPVALPNSQLRLAICNLSELTFQSGTLEIGDPTNGRTAEVRFTEGTKLDLDGSSQIIVKNGSKLIIEAGAELNLAAGAQIILAGSDAVLEIEGTLQLGNNQNLSIGTLSGQTPGYIRFLPGAQVLAGSGAQIALGVPNNFRKVLELAPNAQISLPASLAQFTIHHGEVQMAPGSRLMVATKAVFVNARFERLGSSGMHHGVLLSGNHAHQITASRFNNAITGLEVNLMGNVNQPQLLVNQFNNNQVGLLVHGGGILVGSGGFNGNSQRALHLSAMSAATQINNVNFSNNGHGIKVSSANSHPITINGCTITQNSLQTSSIGIEALQGNITCRSNTISNYAVGIQGMGQNATIRLACNTIANCEEALIAYNHSVIDLSNQARNNVNNSVYAAMYTDFGTFLLQNGYNDLSNSNAYPIFGNMAPNCYSLVTVNTKTGPETFFDLPAENNKFESGFYYPNANMPSFPSGLEVDFHSCDAAGAMWIDYGNTYPMFRKANNSNIAFVTCSQADPPWWRDLFNAVNLDSDPSQWIVTTPLFPGVELKEAIRTALNEISTILDDPKQDSLALARFKQILTASYNNMNETGRELLATANAAMNFALTNAYALGILPVEYGVNPEPLDDAVYVLLASLDDLIANHDDPGMKSKFALDKVLLYRLAGHYEAAINELQNSEANQHSNYSYWYCILQLEWEFFQGVISVEQFAFEAENCMGYFQSRRQRKQPPLLPVYQNQASNTMVISPNPTSNSSLFSFNACEHISYFRVLDPQGRVVSSSELSVGMTEFKLDADKLRAGIYVVELHQPNQKVLRSKWIIHK